MVEQSKVDTKVPIKAEYLKILPIYAIPSRNAMGVILSFVAYRTEVYVLL